MYNYCTEYIQGQNLNNTNGLFRSFQIITIPSTPNINLQHPRATSQRKGGEDKKTRRSPTFPNR
jgi:hypothetical protein